jgi:hypothetical protein
MPDNQEEVNPQRFGGFSYHMVSSGEATDRQEHLQSALVQNIMALYGQVDESAKPSAEQQEKMQRFASQEEMFRQFMERSMADEGTQTAFETHMRGFHVRQEAFLNSAVELSQELAKSQNPRAC